MQDESEQSEDQERLTETPAPDDAPVNEVGNEDDVDVGFDAAAAMRQPTADTPLDYDLPCSKCGYNLRHLGRNGRCPECGQFVNITLAARMAEQLRPAGRWLALVATGILLLLISWILTATAFSWALDTVLTVGVAGPKLALFAVATNDAFWSGSPLRMSPLILSVFVHSGALVLLYWPERRHQLDRMGWFVISGVAVVVAIVGSYIGAGGFREVYWKVMSFRILPVLLLVEAVLVVIECVRAAAIAARLRWKWLGRGFWIIAGAQAFALFTLLLAGLSERPEGAQVMGNILWWFGAAAGMVVFLWLLVVLIIEIRRGQLRRNLKNPPSVQ